MASSLFAAGLDPSDDEELPPPPRSIFTANTMAAGIGNGLPSATMASESMKGVEQVPSEDVAALEATYQQTAIKVGPEVADFATFLDNYNTLRGSPAEKRAQIFKLVATFHSYTRQRLDALSDGGRREKIRKKLDGSSGGHLRDGAIGMDIDDSDDGAPTDDASTSASASASPEEQRHQLEQEAQTWDLLRYVLPIRYRDHHHHHQVAVAQPVPSAAAATNGGPLRSRREYWQEFIISDSLARERKIILEWLQSSASTGPPVDHIVRELQQRADRGDILTHGWLHTRHKIKLQKRVNVYAGVLDPTDPSVEGSHLSSRTLVTQLDPDAPTRQGRTLEAQDASFEKAIWLGCFALLRRGASMSEIRDWCAARTESWRAALISALPLPRGADGAEVVDEDDDAPDFDANAIILWRRMCYAAARRGGCDASERAVYGLLAGDIASIETVCQSWDDLVFAHYNALLRAQFDAFLIKRGGAAAAELVHGSLPVFDAVQQHGDPVTVGKRLVVSLENDERAQGEARTTAKAVQGAIIAHDLDRHLYQQGLILAKLANKDRPSKLIPDLQLPAPEPSPKFFTLSDHDSMRILAHVLIIISTLDALSGGGSTSSTNDRPLNTKSKDVDDDGGSSLGALQIRHRVQENIIAAYVSFLRLAGMEEVVPLYCSKLRGVRVYHALSRNLIHVTDGEARLQHLATMRQLRINIAEFVKTQPHIFLQDIDEASAPCLALGAFKVLEPGTPTVRYGRMIRADFMGDDSKEMVVEDEIVIRAMEWMMLVPGLFVETCRYAIRIYKYFLKQMHLVAAREMYNRVPMRAIVRDKLGLAMPTADDDPSPGWFVDLAMGDVPDEMLQQAGVGPDEIVTLLRTLWELECLVKALDAIETVASTAHMARNNKGKLSRDLLAAANQEMRLAKECMRPILQDWLLFHHDVDADFLALREAYIPETVLAYISAQHFLGTTASRDHLLEIMDLATILADDRECEVAREFTRAGRLKELVASLTSASKALAINAGDKRAASYSNNKKARELGWSKDLWAVKTE